MIGNMLGKYNKGNGNVSCGNGANVSTIHFLKACLLYTSNYLSVLFYLLYLTGAGGQPARSREGKAADVYHSDKYLPDPDGTSVPDRAEGQ